MSGPVEQLSDALRDCYRVEAQIGDGASSVVYGAEDLRHRRKVAIKVLRPELSAELGADRFLREIETTARLRHPHILPLYDSGHTSGLLYYVMPLVEGPSLEEYLERKGGLSLQEALHIADTVADALAYAHARGVVHRDIKPSNILLDGGHAVVSDFGISHALSASGARTLTQAGTILGTPRYMSPEQADGMSVDPRSDLYSLGCVTYEMLAGTPPFNAPTPLVLLARHAMEPVPDLRQACPHVPVEVAAAIERSLAKRPDDRFATIAEWRDALIGSLDTRTSEAPEAERTELDLAPPDKPTVAILPFKNLGADQERDLFSDGIRLGIQATLVQLSGMFLVNVPILNTYRDTESTVETVGAELGVRYILEGAVQQSGERIRVMVQLTDVHDRKAIWADLYDRNLEDVFVVQDEITKEVISALNVKLIGSEAQRVWYSKLRSPEAREAFYRGSSHLYAGTPSDNAEARRQFEHLHSVQPDSVVGPSMVAATHWMDLFFNWTEDPAESAVEATKWAQRAIEYEENNGLGHAIYGHLLLFERDFDEAIAVCTEGVRLRGSCPLARGLLGMVLHYSGNAPDAIREVREAMRLERVYPAWLLDVLAAAYRDSGDVDLSITAARESLRLVPEDLAAMVVLCSDYQLAGEHARAKRVARDIADRDPTFGVSAYLARHPYKDLSTQARLQQALLEAGLPD